MTPSATVRERLHDARLTVRTRNLFDFSAHGMDDDGPVHRASRDLHAIANHTVNNWENQALGYSRTRAGLPPLPMF